MTLIKKKHDNNNEFNDDYIINENIKSKNLYKFSCKVWMIIFIVFLLKLKLYAKLLKLY